MPSLILGITLTIINLVGYSAMAGAIGGGGGLGDLAIRFGLYRFQTDIMIVSVIIIILLVQSIQYLGNKLSNVINKKIRGNNIEKVHFNFINYCIIFYHIN